MADKTIEFLEQDACLYWPASLSEIVANISSIPILIKTQDQFLSILKSSDRDPIAWLNTLTVSSSLSPNIFLKHLMVLSDLSGERLQRISRDFGKIFKSGKMEFVWNGRDHEYAFVGNTKKWNNSNLKVIKASLSKATQLNEEMKDVIMLLLWGANITDIQYLPKEIIEKCVIGNMLGKPDELELFVKQRYIYVSRITGGSTANDFGHECESYAKKYIAARLDSRFEIKGHNIEGISHNEKNLTTFDLVVKNIESNVCFAIEISFQVTTNSVIERKSGLAQSRRELLNSKGHKVIYIIDGSGNFQRKNAIKTILNYSDLVVNFSDDGLNELVSFISKT